MKLKYWSCSKFADWLRGTPKPFSGTAEEWNAWEKKAKVKKFRYWLAEEGLDYLESFVYWPKCRLNDLRRYINNRYIVKTHALTSCLKRGEWYEFDTRLLHAAFDELVNFVEIELAAAFIASSDEERKICKSTWYRAFFCINSGRNPEGGIAYLNWASRLKSDEDWIDKNDPDYGQPTHQALVAQETLKLYRWWKEERAIRSDPSEVSGWSKYCDEKRTAASANNDDTGLGFFIRNKIDDERSLILNAYLNMETEQEEEDTAMLIRLVKIRQGLWT